MRARVALMAYCALLCAAEVAFAQTTPAPRPASAKQREILFGAVVSGPLSMGTTDAELLGGNGQPSVVLFTAENKVSFGIGPSVALAFQMKRKLWIEVSGAFIKTGLRSTITDDFESAADVSIDSPVNRFTVDGAVLWYFRDKGNTAWFVRGSGGFMYDTSGDLTLAEPGFLGTGGVGMRYWWKTNGKGTFKRAGIRAEARMIFQSGGASLSDRSFAFGPGGAVHLVFGY